MPSSFQENWENLSTSDVEVCGNVMYQTMDEILKLEVIIIIFWSFIYIFTIYFLGPPSLPYVIFPQNVYQ
jgi:hypothetical protein